jgi:AcrR family transcriptional regulator
MTDPGVPDDAPPDPARRRPRGPALSADRIAAEALRLIDEAGLDGFGFRPLAARLGCQAMSLYRYFPSKAHLFEELVNRCLAEHPAPDAALPWREKLVRRAHDFRRIALDHPGFFPYFAVFRMNNRAGLAFIDGVVATLAEAGLPPEAQARHFRAIGYYLTGAGLEEALGYTRGPSATDPVPPDQAARDYPAITAIGRWFAADERQATFDAGLAVFLDRIEADIRAGTPA